MKRYKLTDEQKKKVILFLTRDFKELDLSEIIGHTIEEIRDAYKSQLGDAVFEFKDTPIYNPLRDERGFLITSMFYSPELSSIRYEYNRMCDYYGEENINNYFGEYLKHIGELVEVDDEVIVESIDFTPNDEEKIKKIYSDVTLTDDEKSMKLWDTPVDEVKKFSAYNYYINNLDELYKKSRKVKDNYPELYDYIKGLNDQEQYDLLVDWRKEVESKSKECEFYDIFYAMNGIDRAYSIYSTFNFGGNKYNKWRRIKDSIEFWKGRIGPDTFLEAYVDTKEKPIYTSDKYTMYKFTGDNLPDVRHIVDDENDVNTSTGLLLISENDSGDDDFVTEGDCQYLIDLDNFQLYEVDPYEDISSLDDLKNRLSAKDPNVWPVIDKELKEVSLYYKNDPNNSNKIEHKFSWMDFKPEILNSNKYRNDYLTGEVMYDVLMFDYNPNYYLDDVDWNALIDCISDENWKRIEQELHLTKEEVLEDAPQEFYTAVRNAYERCMFNSEYSKLLADILEDVKDCLPKSLLSCFDITSDGIDVHMNREQLDELFSEYLKLRVHNTYLDEIYWESELETMISKFLEDLSVRERNTYMDFSNYEFNEALEAALGEL